MSSRPEGTGTKKVVRPSARSSSKTVSTTKGRIEEAQRLIRSLMKKNVTIEDFAAKIGADRRSVARWRAGTTAPHPILLDNLRKLDAMTPVEKDIL